MTQEKEWSSSNYPLEYIYFTWLWCSFMLIIKCLTQKTHFQVQWCYFRKDQNGHKTGFLCQLFSTALIRNLRFTLENLAAKFWDDDIQVVCWWTATAWIHCDQCCIHRAPQWHALLMSVLVVGHWSELTAISVTLIVTILPNPCSSLNKHLIDLDAWHSSPSQASGSIYRLSGAEDQIQPVD